MRLCVTTSVRHSVSGLCVHTSELGCETWYVGVYVCSTGELGHELRIFLCDHFDCILHVWPISGCLILFLRIQVLKLICCVTDVVFPHVLKECNIFLKCWGGQRYLKKWSSRTLKMRTKFQYTLTQWCGIISQRTSIHNQINVEASNLMLLFCFCSVFSFCFSLVLFCFFFFFNPQGGCSIPCVCGNAPVARVWGWSGQSIGYSIACHHTLELCLNLQVCTVSPGNVYWNSATSLMV